MSTYQQSEQSRRELDRRFRSTLVQQGLARPHAGWIRAIRQALGMSQAVLAGRLGVSDVAVSKLERAELDGGITVAKLAEVAAALDCRLMYALVPNTTLEDTVQHQARQTAESQLGYVARTMSLEDQTVAGDRQADILERHARELILAGRIWPAPGSRTDRGKQAR